LELLLIALIALTPVVLFAGLLALVARTGRSWRRILLVLLIWEVAASAVIYALFGAARTEALAEGLDNIGIGILFGALWLWTAIAVPVSGGLLYGLWAWYNPRDKP
jgi:H+/Cl- antiporter ClcA